MHRFRARIFIVILVSALPFVSFAQSLNTNPTAYESKIELTLPSLDKAWADRESEQGQKQILNFVSGEPKIPQNFEIAWRFARLVYYVGNFGIGRDLPEKEKVKIFQYGYRAAEIAKKLEPGKVQGYYWYATNLGSYGLAKGILSALSNAKDGRDALLEAAKIDPTYQWGGPYRILGKYYQEVPSVISFGDKKKALDYFNKAVEIDPDYRLNLFYLGMLKKDLGDTKVALNLFEQAEKKQDKDGMNEEKRYKQDLKENLEKLRK